MNTDEVIKILRCNKTVKRPEHCKRINCKALTSHGGCADWIAKIQVADAVEKLQRENDALREANRWIPVTESVPENNDYKSYLIKTKNSYGIAGKDKAGWFSYYTKGTDHPIEKAYFHSVSHWRPLTAPPEQEITK